MSEEQFFSTSEIMKENQSKGKAWRKKKKKKLDGRKKYWKKSFDDNLSLDEVKELYSLLNKQAFKIDKYNIDSDGMPTEDYISWLECGGSAGLSWCTKQLQELEIVKSKQAVTEDDLEQEEDNHFTDVSVIKSKDNELMQGTFLVLEPDSVDLHGDTYDEAEVRKGCHNFNQHCMKSNLLHLVETDTFSIVESYIVPTDIVLEDTFIKKGSWLAVLQFHDEDVWNMVKDDPAAGVSIGGFSKVEEL